MTVVGRVLATATICILSWAGAACEDVATSVELLSAQEFRELEATGEEVELDNVDYALLTQAIFHETNRRRSDNGLERLERLEALDRAACGHARAMVEQDFFAHRNPASEELTTPADRVRAQGLSPGFVAENIGQVFALRYESGERVYTRQEDGRTVFTREPGGEPLGRRSYLQLAASVLDGWMASEGHRQNILSARPSYLGVGCELTEDGALEMPMFVCVQLFFTPLD